MILMHNRSNPASVEVREKLGNAYIGAEYENLIEDVKRELLECVAIAKKAQIADSLLFWTQASALARRANIIWS